MRLNPVVDLEEAESISISTEFAEKMRRMFKGGKGAEVGAHMLYTTNEDVPGIIGTLGQTMGENGVNIANFTLGRAEEKGEAIALLYVDEVVPTPVIDKLCATGMFKQVKPLEFDVA